MNIIEDRLYAHSQYLDTFKDIQYDYLDNGRNYRKTIDNFYKYEIVHRVPVRNNGNNITRIFSPINFTQLLQELNNQMQAQEDVAVTLTTDEINKYDTSKLSYCELLEKREIDENESCAICLKRIKPDSEESYNTKCYTYLPCTHIFCSSCILEYFAKYNYKCPVCNSECGEHAPQL